MSTEKQLEAGRRYYAMHKESLNKKRQLYRENNREKARVYNKKYREDNLVRLRTMSRDYMRNHKEKYDAMSRTRYRSPSGKFSSYKHSASRRGIEFALTIEDFISMWKIPCFYCGIEIDEIGIDRIDNTMGYTRDNIHPCCRMCNIAKNNHTLDEFTEWSKRLYNKINKWGK